MVLLRRSRITQGGRRCFFARVVNIDRSIIQRILLSQLTLPAIW